MIQLNNITKIYGKGKNAVAALNNLNITFGSKGLVVILGKSGSGKSTLLNILAGLDKPTSGELIVNGKSASSFSSSEFDSYRNTYVGMVFQEFNLIDEITVYQNIEITLKLQRRNPNINTIDEVLSMVGLANLGYRKPAELSGGQRQRVALARALLKKPQILLADEPTGSLDASTGEEVFEVLKKLARDQLVVAVTHDRELAFSYGERIIELVDGQAISDKEIQLDSFVPVKALSDNVIEVSAGGKITAQDINKKLKNNSHNYVGISHDKDRIALAYPETFDSFYLPREKIKMRDTAVENITDDGKPFILQKGALTVKDTIYMAKVNKKRAKKRFRFITFLNTLCFALLSVSIIMSMVNLPDVIAKSAFDTYSQNIVAVTDNEDSYWDTNISLSESDVQEIEEIVGDRKLNRVYSMYLFPYYAVSSQDLTEGIGSIAGMLMSGLKPIDMTLNCYTGVIEGENISDLGVKLIDGGGSGIPQNYDEIIISDFAADKLLSRGFFGLDSSGKEGIYFLKEPGELIGMSVKMVNYDWTLKISGIYKTDYQRYKYLIKPEERVLTDSNIDIKNWQNNKDFLYSKIFVKEGFLDHYFGTSETININFNGLNINLDVDTLKFRDNYFLNPVDTNQDAFIWVSPFSQYKRTVTIAGREQDFPRSDVQGVSISIQLMQFIYPDFDLNNDIDIDGDLISDYRFLYVSNGRENLSAQIIAIYDALNFEAPPMPITINSQDYINQLKNMFDMGQPYTMTSVMFERGTNYNEIKALAAELISRNYLMFCSVGSVREFLRLGDLFGVAAELFLYMSLGVAVFSFLLILNYMSSSVRFRAKEIAVYRVIGARRLDVAKIFLTEGLYMSFTSSIFACILGAIITYFFNSSFKGMLQIFNLSFSILSFNIFIIVIVFAMIAAFVTLASLLPIMAITRRKAIDALKVIG